MALRLAAATPISSRGSAVASLGNGKPAPKEPKQSAIPPSPHTKGVCALISCTCHSRHLLRVWASTIVAPASVQFWCYKHYPWGTESEWTVQRHDQYAT